jgi:hypothetical protein
MSKPEQLETIDLAALAQVSGGATATPTSNDQVFTALAGILDSIQSLASQQNTGGFNQQEMMMLMMIMQQHNQQQVATAWPWSQEPIIRYF